MGVVRGQGAAGAPEAVSGAPKKNGGLFTFCPSSANGRTSARVPARRRGQLRRCPRWRRRGVKLPGRCSRAQRRRGGRVLPRQVTRAAPGRASGAAEPGRTLWRRARLRAGARRSARPRASGRRRSQRQSLPAGTGGPGARAAVRSGGSVPRAAGLGSPGRRTRGGAVMAERQPCCQPAVLVGALPPCPSVKKPPEAWPWLSACPCPGRAVSAKKKSGVVPQRALTASAFACVTLPQVTCSSWEDAFFWE